MKLIWNCGQLKFLTKSFLELSVLEQMDSTTLQDLPPDCISLIKTRLGNYSLDQFNETCPEVENAPMSRVECAARDCGYFGLTAFQIFEDRLLVCGHFKCFKYALSRVEDKYKKIPMVCDEWLLIHSCINGHFKIVEYLLQNDLVKNKILAFTQATLHNRYRIAKMFLDSGVTCQQIMSVNIIMASHFYEKSFISTRSYKKQGHFLRKLARYGRQEIILMLIERGLTLDDLKCGNGSLLRWAVQKDQADLVRLYLKMGLGEDEIRAKDNRALYYARNKYEMTKILLDAAPQLVHFVGANILLNIAHSRNVHILELYFSKGLTLAEIQQREDESLGTKDTYESLALGGYHETLEFLMSKGLVFTKEQLSRMLKMNEDLRDSAMGPFYGTEKTIALLESKLNP